MANLETYIEKYRNAQAKVGQCDLVDRTLTGQIDLRTYNRLIDPEPCMECPIKRVFSEAIHDPDLCPTDTTTLAGSIAKGGCRNPFILSQAEGLSEAPKQGDTIGAMYARKGLLIK